MLKKLFIGLLVPVILSLGLGITSCVKDPTPEEQQKQKKEQASRFWKVAGQLVSVDDITDDYQDKTFEPTIGTPAAGDPLTRIVSTNSLRAAVERFNRLVDGSITNETGTYTFDNPDVGTLTWTKNSDGKAWATVDVNIKQIPRLKTIVYQSPEQGNENGKFDGKSYYRFGDVVKRTYKGVEEYWICVRPCFGPEGKEKSHWVCVNALPEGDDGNVFKYDSENWTGHFWIPTELGTNKEHMQGFAEMLYAICQPGNWERNVSLYSTEGIFGPDGLPFFHDFHGSNLYLHNKYFWQNVQDAWIRNNIAQKALNLGGLGDLADNIESDGVNLLYYGYSWWTWWDDELTLYQASYTNGSSNEELNLHHASYDEIVKNVNGIAKLDFRKMGSNKDDYKAFFGDNKLRWVIRHATGAELSETGDHGPQQPLSGVEEVYRYYHDVYTIQDLNDLEGPEETPDPYFNPGGAFNAPQDGSGTYLMGDVVKDEQGNRWICVLGSPWNEYTAPMVSDHRATFVSFEFKGVDTSGDKIPGLPNEADAIRVGGQFISALKGLRDAKGKANYDVGQDGSLGVLLNHMRLYADWDVRKATVTLDSTWTFTGWKNGVPSQTYDSPSTSMILNIAYDDGTPGKQALLRVICDCTQGGGKREYCVAKSGTKYDNAYYRMYRYYETYDPARMREPTEDETSLGMTAYNCPWAMSTDKIYLQDVASQAMVNRHAKDDKWVRLPLTIDSKGETTGPRRTPRTTAESVKPRDFIGVYGIEGSPTKTNMFNEPVLVMRVMYVTDNGGIEPNLVSDDGRRLSIVHLQDDKDLYRSNYQSFWAIAYSVSATYFYTLDNEQYEMPSLQ